MVGGYSSRTYGLFCPQLDDSAVARELAITDSEHSDAEVSCTDNGTFNLSRGQTPLTEGSEGEGGRPPWRAGVRSWLMMVWEKPPGALQEDTGDVSCLLEAKAQTPVFSQT